MSEKRILIIDDEPLIRRALSDYLVECGYDTTAADDGERGLIAARTEQFDVILIDLRMPNMGGLQVIDILKVEQPELPVVVVSGTGVLNDAVEALRLGAWDYITKPIRDMAEIVVVVERVLDRAHLKSKRAQAEKALQDAHHKLEQRVRERTAELTDANISLQAEITARCQAEDALQKKSRQQEHLIETARHLTASLDLKEVLTRIGLGAKEILKAYGCDIYLLEDDGDTLTPVVAIEPLYEQEILSTPLSVESSMTGQAVRARRGLIFNDPTSEESSQQIPDTPVEEDERIIVAPFIIDDRELGVVCLTRRGTPFTQEDLTLAETFAAYATTALKNAQTYRELQYEVEERIRAEDDLRRRAAHQEALNTVIGAAATAAGPAELLEIALVQTLSALGLEIGTVWMPPHVCMRGLPPDILEGVARTMRDSGLDIPEASWMEDWQQARDDDPRAALGLARIGIRASLTVPLLVEGRRIGGLSLAARAPRTWSLEEIALVEAVGQELGAAAERLHLIVQIQEQAQQVQQIIDTVPEGVLLLDADMRILLDNPPAEEYLPALASAKMGEILTHLGGRPLAELLASPPEGLWHQVEIDGPQPQSFELIAQAIQVGPSTGRWVLVIRDVTQERKVQERVQRQEQLAVVGQLAAGIAHDFSNIMAVITLYSQMVQRTPDLSQETRAHLETVDRQAKRAADLIQQILDFSRQSVLERSRLDLAPLLKEQVKLLERTLPESIQLGLTYGSGKHTVNADPTRMQQVFMNLAVNSRDAMPAGGWLRIALERIQVTDKKPLPNIKAGEWIRVTVSDDGMGISAEHLPHIFEPFFTTKEAGRGTGLGLAQVYGIVKQHQGHIDVASKIGGGTTFAIYLPALSTREPAMMEPAAPELTTGNGETVLVVEDNPVTREALVDSLALLNYSVLQAANGREALVIHEQHGDEIALTVSDLVMPEMGGMALMNTLKSQNPAIKMVIISGHPLREQIEDMQLQGVKAWLQKPLDLDQLAQVIAQAIRAK